MVGRRGGRRRRVVKRRVVTRDIVGSSASCTFDSLSTMAIGDLVKVIGWYDNEWGYSNRLVDLAELVAAAL